MSANIVEIPVYIKTYKAYQRNKLYKEPGSFVGLRETERYKEITIYNPLAKIKLAEFLRKHEPYFICFYDLYKFSASPGEPYLNYPFSLQDGNDAIHREAAIHICHMMEDIVKPVKKNIYPQELPDEDCIKDVDSGVYVDIFRKDRKGKVFLRAEYQFQDDKKWHVISVLDLSPQRRPQAQGAEHINIPANQECFLMLSKNLQCAERLEYIRSVIEEDGNARRCPRVTRFPVLDYENEDHPMTPPKELPDKDPHAMTVKEKTMMIKTLKENNEAVLPDYIGPDIYNVIMEKGKTDVTLLVPDYESYGAELFRAFTEVKNRIDENTGETSDENKLKYLVAIVCSQYNCWNELNDLNDIRGILAKLYNDNKIAMAWMLVIAGNLAEWILQPAYQDMMYDYIFQLQRKPGDLNKRINELFCSFLDAIHELPTTKKAREEYFTDAWDVLLSVFRGKAGASLPEDEFKRDYLDKYFLEGENVLHHEFSLLETYKEHNNRNYLADFLLPAKSPQGLELGYRLLESVGDIFIEKGGTLYKFDNLLHLIEHSLNRIAGGTVAILRKPTPAHNSSAFAWSETADGRRLLHYNYNASDNKPINLKNTISKTIAVMNCLFAVGELSGEGASAAEGLQLLAAAIDLADEYKILQGTGKFAWGYGYAAAGINMASGILKGLQDVSRGDEAAGAVEIGSSVVSGLSLIALKMMGISAGPYYLVLALFSIAGPLLADSLRTDDLEKWVRYSKYGREFTNLTENNNGWTSFCEKYLSYQKINENSFVPENNEKMTTYWRGIYQSSGSIVSENQSMEKTQIEIYNRIINDFTLTMIRVSPFGDSACWNIFRFEIDSPAYGSDYQFCILLQVSGFDNSFIRRESPKRHFAILPDKRYLKYTGTRCRTVFYIYSDSTGKGGIGENGIRRLTYHFNDYDRNEDRTKYANIKTNYIVDNELIEFCNNEEISNKNISLMAQLFSLTKNGERDKMIINKKIANVGSIESLERIMLRVGDL